MEIAILIGSKSSAMGAQRGKMIVCKKPSSGYAAVSTFARSPVKLPSILASLPVLFCCASALVALPASQESMRRAEGKLTLSVKATCLEVCAAERKTCTSLKTGGAEQAMVCWEVFRNCKKQCASGSSPDAKGAQASIQPDKVKLDAIVWPVGKWPEGVTSSDSSIWVAISGERRIVELDRISGEELQSIKVGRFPVDMATDSAGEIFSLVYTDFVVWSQPTLGRGKKLAKLDGYPAGMVANDRALWILINPDADGWSGKTKVVLVDQKSGRLNTSQTFDSLVNGSDIATSNRNVWVVHGSNSGRSRISLFDAYSLSSSGKIEIDAFVTKITANPKGVFVGGGVWDQSGVVIKFNPRQEVEAARVALPGQFIAALTADEHHVIAAGRNGRIWLLSPDDLSIERVIDLSIGSFVPSDIVAIGNRLFLTTHRGEGDNGSVIVVDDARSVLSQCAAACDKDEEQCHHDAGVDAVHGGSDKAFRTAVGACAAKQRQCRNDC